jgi:hypothetical protein
VIEAGNVVGIRHNEETFQHLGQLIKNLRVPTLLDRQKWSLGAIKENRYSKPEGSPTLT